MKTVEQNSTDWSIRFFAYDVDGAAVTGLTHASGGMAASVVVRSKGRIVSTTSLTLSARSQVGVHQDSAMTEVGSGEYVIDLADSYFTTVDRTISLTVSATAITGNVLVEMLEVTDTFAIASTAVVAARVPIGSTVGWPVELVIGDARLTALGTAPLLYVKNADDEIITGYGTKNFADADFRAVLRLSPLTTVTRDLDEPPATIEVATDDSPGIVWNDDVSGSEYFELQIPKAQADLGVIRTRYSCQFIMNWGATDIYESTINLGEIEFIRKNDDVAA